MSTYSFTVSKDGLPIAQIELGEPENGLRSLKREEPGSWMATAVADAPHWEGLLHIVGDALTGRQDEELAREAKELRRRLAAIEAQGEGQQAQWLRKVVYELHSRAISGLAQAIDMGDDFGCAQFCAAADELSKGIDWEAIGLSLPEDHGIPDFVFVVSGDSA